MKNTDWFFILNFMFAWLGAFGLLYAILLISIIVTALILRFYCLKPLANTPVFRPMREAFETTDSRAKHFGFHYLGLFGTGLNHLAIWENPERSTVLTLSLDNPRPYYRFQTVFDENILLDTNNQRSSLMLPVPPGHYMQAFPDDGPDRLWQNHLEAISWLEEYENVRLIPGHPDFPWGNIDTEGTGPRRDRLASQAVLVRSARSQGKYLLRSFRQFLLLPLTAIFRWFSRSGKPVRRLVEQERLPAPDRLPEDRRKYSADPPAGYDESTRSGALPEYSESGLSVPYTQGFVRKWLVPGAVVCGVVGMFAFLMVQAIYVPAATEETQSLQKLFREHLFDFEYGKALETAEAISQPYWREEAYFFAARQQAETGRFDDCRETMKNIVGKCYRYHSPPIVWTVRRHLITALAADGRFDEAEKILYDNSFFYGSELPVCRYYLAAGMPEKSLALLKNGKKSDPYYEVLRDTVAGLARSGEFEKALETAKTMEFDGWQHGAYREIVRESLIRNEYGNAEKVFGCFKLFRYRQQAAALLMIWHLERDEVEKARRLYEEHLVDRSENERIDTENDKDSGSNHEDWKRQNAVRQKLPYGHNDWRRIVQTIFLRFGRGEEAKQVGDLISAPENRRHHVTVTTLPPESRPETKLSEQEAIEKRIEENLAAIRGYSGAGEEDLRLLRLTQLIILNHQLGKTDEALKLLEECRDGLREMPLPDPFHPESRRESGKRLLRHLFDAELFLGKFDEAEKTALRFGITDTMASLISHEKLAASFLESGLEAGAKEHALLAWKFAKRIDAAVPEKDRNFMVETWPQAVAEIAALPDLLERSGFPEQAGEARNRFAPPPRLRLLRFYRDTDFTFPDPSSYEKR